ncbi:GNAT family protein [Actinocorallia lasiicapitis]
MIDIAELECLPEASLRTDRLSLEPFSSADLEALTALGHDPEGLPPGVPETAPELAEWLGRGAAEFRTSGSGAHFAIRERSTGRHLGAISLYRLDLAARLCEIGYGLRPAHRGRGYATEACAAVARWALTSGGLQRVQLRANTDNPASLRVAEKAGFLREGTLRRANLEADGLHDLAVFSLLDSDLEP